MKLLQTMLIFKSFVAMLMGDDSLKSVGEMSYALLETPAFDLAAQHLKRDPACAQEAWDKPLSQWQAELNIQPIQNH